ncbi:MAG: hypothetical protein PHE49_08110 [bacterium]|nr:hypothetical protein [bacterium]
MLKKIFGIFIFLLLFRNVYASEYTGEILNLEIGGRACGLGGAYCSILDGNALSSWWNPVNILQRQGVSVGAMKGKEFGLFDFNCFGAGITKRNWEIGNYPNVYIINNIAASILFGTIGMDSIPEFPDTLVTKPTGYFGASEQVVLFTLAFSIPQIKNSKVGLNVKYLRYDIFNTQANGIGLDFGANYRYKKMSTGIVIKNVGGTNIIWATNKQDKRPMSVIAGTNYRTKESLVALDLGYEYGSIIYRLGMEYTIWDLISIRMGINKGLAFGVGLKPDIPESWGATRIKGLTIDYAFTTKELGSVSHISMGLNF